MKLTDITPGQTVTLDAGFTCHKAGPVGVKSDDLGLYFECTAGHHYLDGQEDEAGELIGIS